MTISEKVAYLKGLFEGMEIDANKKEGKLFSLTLDILEDLARSVSDLEEVTSEMGDELDELYEDMEEIEEQLADEDDCACSDDELYEVVCPTCGESICMDAGVLDEGKINCPACGEELEFDFSGLEDEEGCTCGCEDE